MPRVSARILLALVIAAIVLVTGSLIIVLITSHPASPAPPPGVSGQQNPPPAQPPAGTTALQDLKADWGPFTQLPASQQDPQTGAPALLLLENGGYYVTTWTIPASNPAWSPDLSGSISGVDVRGNYAVITDADGNQWVVGTSQPFVLASDPGTILEADATGTIMAMPESHAIAIRRHL